MELLYFLFLCLYLEVKRLTLFPPYSLCQVISSALCSNHIHHEGCLKKIGLMFDECPEGADAYQLGHIVNLRESPQYSPMGVWCYCFNSLSRTHSINAQCRSIPKLKLKLKMKFISMHINSSQYRSMPINVRSDCVYGIDPNADQFCSILINANQLISIRINSIILISIDRHWSALGIDQGSPDETIKQNYQEGCSCVLVAKLQPNQLFIRAF